MSDFLSPARTGHTLSALWTFAILNTVFRDLHEMAKADTVQQILDGTLNGAPVTDGALVAGAFAVQALLLAPVLSVLLTPRAARYANLILAPLALAGTFLIPPSDPDHYVFAAVTTATFLTIFTVAWRWPDVRSPEDGGRHAGVA